MGAPLTLAYSGDVKPPPDKGRLVTRHCLKTPVSALPPSSFLIFHYFHVSNSVETNLYQPLLFQMVSECNILTPGIL